LLIFYLFPKSDFVSISKRGLDVGINEQEKNIPFFDLLSFIILSVICVQAVIIYLLILLLLSYNGIIILNIMHLMPIIFSCMFGFFLICIVYVSKFLVFIIPMPISEELKTTILKKHTLNDIRAHLFSNSWFIQRFIITIFLYISTFVFNLFETGLEKDIYFMHGLSCVLIAVIITYLSSLLQNKKFLSKPNLIQILYLTFILIIAKFLAIYFTFYLNNIYCYYFVNISNKNIIKSINTYEFDKLFKLHGDKIVAYLNYNLNKTEPLAFFSSKLLNGYNKEYLVCSANKSLTIYQSLTSFLQSQKNSFFKVFNQKTNYSYLPE